MARLGRVGWRVHQGSCWGISWHHRSVYSARQTDARPILRAFATAVAPAETPAPSIPAPERHLLKRGGLYRRPPAFALASPQAGARDGDSFRTRRTHLGCPGSTYRRPCPCRSAARSPSTKRRTPARRERCPASRRCSAPAGQCGWATQLGPYNGLGAGHDAIRHYCRANNRQLAGAGGEYGQWQSEWNANPSQI
jgi:hypothetical protein